MGQGRAQQQKCRFSLVNFRTRERAKIVKDVNNMWKRLAEILYE